MYGRGEHSRIPVDGYSNYYAIQDPVIDTAALLLSELPNDSLNIIDF